MKNNYDLFPSFFFNNLNSKHTTTKMCSLYNEYSNIYLFALIFNRRITLKQEYFQVSTVVLPANLLQKELTSSQG